MLVDLFLCIFPFFVALLLLRFAGQKRAIAKISACMVSSNMFAIEKLKNNKLYFRMLETLELWLAN